MDIAADMPQIKWLGGVIEHVAAGLDLTHVFGEALWVDADHHVDTTAPAQIAIAADPDFIPGRKSLNIGWENIPWAYRDPHTEYRLGEHAIGAGRTGAVDVGELNDKVVDRLLGLHAYPALVTE